MALTWTVAYRRIEPEAEPVFHRVNLEVGWQRSTELAGEFIKALGEDYSVWYTTTRASELTDSVSREDVGNILVDIQDDDTEVRIPIADDGLTLAELSAQV